MDEHAARDGDQAAGLRRLFGTAPARLAPILLEPGRSASEVTSILGLAQACARAGERTLVLDCARAQVAATLGLRARFDLVHAMRGECSFEQVRLDAGSNLCVVPAARAVAEARGAEVEFMAVVGALANGSFGRFTADLVLMIIEPAQATLLRACKAHSEVVVPMPRLRAAWGVVLRALASVGDRVDIAGFRLLFPAWDADTAARLYAELVQACSERLRIELRFGGAVPVAHDWARVTRAMSEWELLRLPRPQTARMF